MSIVIILFDKWHLKDVSFAKISVINNVVFNLVKNLQAVSLSKSLLQVLIFLIYAKNVNHVLFALRQYETISYFAVAAIVILTFNVEE